MTDTPLTADDEMNRTLLHFAARTGDAASADAAIEQGCDPAARDANGMTAADIAAAFGHDDLAADLRARMTAQPELAGPFPAPVLDDAAQLASLVRAGQTAAIVAAFQTAQTVPSLDLLTCPIAGRDDSLLMALLDSGEMATLMAPALWKRDEAALEALWAEIPLDYRKSLDIESLRAAFRADSLPPGSPARRFRPGR